jgi:hypothetical protein
MRNIFKQESSYQPFPSSWLKLVYVMLTSSCVDVNKHLRTASLHTYFFENEEKITEVKIDTCEGRQA